MARINWSTSQLPFTLAFDGERVGFWSTVADTLLVFYPSTPWFYREKLLTLCSRGGYIHPHPIGHRWNSHIYIMDPKSSKGHRRCRWTVDRNGSPVPAWRNWGRYKSTNWASYRMLAGASTNSSTSLITSGSQSKIVPRTTPWWVVPNSYIYSWYSDHGVDITTTAGGGWVGVSSSLFTLISN